MFYIKTDEISPEKTVVSFLFDDGNSLWSFHEGHRFYEQYLKWVAEGNTATEWQPEA
jgi:hypothetical protein